ncbi:hypothetical protein ACTMSW_11520 [Micromonospora sp. BQ11]|uniref:hypothetical protein n=1 Tax=Micromonospora sp. BQ11 TaxID=3452212 RepID=UPI003F8B47AC
MIGRLLRYVRGSYPPVISVMTAVAWTYGVTGLYASVDPRVTTWTPGWSTSIAAATLTVNLLLMRAIDDIRDLEYDRLHSPNRPLAAGRVRITDLFVLYAVGSVVILAINLGNLVALAIVAGQLGYALLVLAAHRWLRWPDGDKLFLTLLISSPAQILLHLYLYAGYLRQVGHPADWPTCLLALGVVILATGHLELAKKIVRVPRPGERTYVTTIGLAPTVGMAMVVAIVSAALFVFSVRPWSPWSLVVLVPLAWPLLALHRFAGQRRNRWPVTFSVLYLLATFAAYAVVGLIVG